MNKVIVRAPCLEDKEVFIEAMQNSISLHSPWLKAPLSSLEFDAYLEKYQQDSYKSYLVIAAASNEIVGVFNLNDIVRGVFQNTYMGYYVVNAYAGKGYMSLGLKQVLYKAFVDLALHRVEANIQPTNERSIQLVKANHFRKEGYSPRYLKVDDEWRDHERWAITSEDYNAHVRA
jgi:RimJ/RimL family protein N-acetyltransferase